MVASGGSYEALLASTLLAIETRLAEALRNYADVLYARRSDNEPINSRMEEAEVEAAYKVTVWFTCSCYLGLV